MVVPNPRPARRVVFLPSAFSATRVFPPNSFSDATVSGESFQLTGGFLAGFVLWHNRFVGNAVKEPTLVSSSHFLLHSRLWTAGFWATCMRKGLHVGKA